MCLLAGYGGLGRHVLHRGLVGAAVAHMILLAMLLPMLMLVPGYKSSNW
jgi:hypothetical protein